MYITANIVKLATGHIILAFKLNSSNDFSVFMYQKEQVIGCTLNIFEFYSLLKWFCSFLK